MDDTDALKALCEAALILWFINCAVFAPLFARTMPNGGYKIPFLIAPLVIAAASTTQAGIYFTATWILPTNTTLGRIALYAVPSALILDAIAYALITVWVRNRASHSARASYTNR